jgi:hypothetical protein
MKAATFSEIREALRGARRILVASHLRPRSGCERKAMK